TVIQLDIAGDFHILPVVWILHVSFGGENFLIIRLDLFRIISALCEYVHADLIVFHLPRTILVLLDLVLGGESVLVDVWIIHVHEPFVASSLGRIQLLYSKFVSVRSGLCSI